MPNTIPAEVSRDCFIGRSLDDYTLETNGAKPMFGSDGHDEPADEALLVACQINWAELVVSGHTAGAYVWNANTANLQTEWVDVGTSPTDGRPLQAALVAVYSIRKQLPRQASMRKADLQLRSPYAGEQQRAHSSTLAARFDKLRQAVVVPDPAESFFVMGRRVTPESSDWAKIADIVSKIDYSSPWPSLYRSLVNSILRTDTSL